MQESRSLLYILIEMLAPSLIGYYNKLGCLTLVNILLLVRYFRVRLGAYLCSTWVSFSFTHKFYPTLKLFVGGKHSSLLQQSNKKDKKL
jgi:hypothetical protein